MKLKILFTVLFISFLIGNLKIFAQNISGTAIYKSHLGIDLQMDHKKMNDAMQDQLQASLAKQFQKEYKLEFNSNESIYEEEKSLDNGSDSGVQVMFLSSSSSSDQSDISYKNIKENRWVNQNDFQGKIFLISGTLEKPNWKLSNESKQIGEYACFKATLEKTITKTRLVDEDGEVKEITTEEIQTVTAWYTPQIPVSFGPENYWGLPGLILEINDGALSLLCTKIVLKTNQDSEIEEPKKGKKVSKETYETIVEKKNKELQEHFKSQRKGEGKSFEFKIGG